MTRLPHNAAHPRHVWGYADSTDSKEGLVESKLGGFCIRCGMLRKRVRRWNKRVAAIESAGAAEEKR